MVCESLPAEFVLGISLSIFHIQQPSLDSVKYLDIIRIFHFKYICIFCVETELDFEIIFFVLYNIKIL